MPMIYLSPSLQSFNLYEGGGNEQEYMNRIADEMEPYLRANGIRFIRSIPGVGLGQVIQDSNSGHYGLHLALHSNAAPEDLSGQLRGADVYYYTWSAAGKRAAEIFANNYRNLYPDPSLVKTIPTRTLAEVSKTNAPAVLLEIAYHDQWKDARWIRTHTKEIAENLVKSITDYFGLPFIENIEPAKKGVIRTSETSLNLHVRPQDSACVLLEMPSHSEVTIWGRWENWYVVEYQGILGYAAVCYISEDLS